MADLADRWSRWLLHDRFGGDAQVLEQTMEFLAPIRDRVLEGARIGPGATVLDVGCGDGLLGFGALPLVGEHGLVVFSDVSDELLERCRRIAEQLEVIDRCRFVRSPAESLAGLEDASVDAVLIRSVLIYVDDKSSAFAAFHRVLRPGGRISLFEPINRRFTELNRKTLFGYDIEPIQDLVAKVRAVFAAASPADGPMMGFDETDLLHLAEDAGYSDITVSLELASVDRPPFTGVDWPRLLAISPNPNAPTYGDAIKRALAPEEADRLESYLRPLVDQGLPGRFRKAGCYLIAQRREP